MTTSKAKRTYPVASIGAVQALEKAAKIGDVGALNKFLKTYGLAQTQRPRAITERPLIFEAAQNGQNAFIEALLDAGADINIEQHEIMISPLTLAVTYQQKETAALLIKRGADLDKYSPLSEAVNKGNLTMAAQLIDAGAKVDGDGQDKSPFLQAVTQMQPGMARFLMEKGASIHAVDSLGRNALYHAARNNMLPVVIGLHKKGLSIESPDHSDTTALMAAANNGHIEVLRYLLDHGAKVDAKDTYQGSTALRWAAQFNHPKCLDLLLARGADPLAENDKGWRALDRAAAFDSPDTLVPLIAAGADIHARDKKESTAFLEAAESRSLKSLEILLNAGADPLAVDIAGDTALTRLAKYCDGFGDNEKACIDFLLDAGVDIHAKNNNGDTVFDKAANLETVNPNLLAFLKEKEVEIAAKKEQARKDLLDQIAQDIGETGTVKEITTLPRANWKRKITLPRPAP